MPSISRAVISGRVFGELVEVAGKALGLPVPEPSSVKCLGSDDRGDLMFDEVDGLWRGRLVIPENCQNIGIFLGERVEDLCALHVAEKGELFIVEVCAASLVHAEDEICPGGVEGGV